MSQRLPGMIRARLEHELAVLQLKELEALREATYFNRRDALHPFTREGYEEYQRLFGKATEAVNAIFGEHQPEDAGYRPFQIQHEDWLASQHELADLVLELIGKEKGVEIWKRDPDDPQSLTYTDAAWEMLREFVEDEITQIIEGVFGPEEEAMQRTRKAVARKERKGIRYWRPEKEK